MLRTDRGGKYVSNEFDEHYKEHGMKHQIIMAYAPQQIGVVERCNRTLIEMCQSMMAPSSLPKILRGKAISIPA